MTRVLITGMGGFTATHLTHHLLSRGEQVFGFGQASTRLSPALAHSVPYYSGDIRSQASLENVLAEVQPDLIYHLAGVLKSARAAEFYEVNVLGTISLFEAIIKVGIAPKVLITSSSAVYGRGFTGRPITEQFKLRPITHYGVSKVAQEAVARHYYRTYKLPVICTRAFNLIGPDQPPVLACSAFARQIALAEQTGPSGPIVTGDLKPQRDFTDVRDAVRAYSLVAKLGKVGLAYNVCSQKAVSVEHCLTILLEMACVSLETRLDASRFQPNDVPVQVGSAARLFKHTGWQPEITLPQSLADLLNSWRQRVKSQSLG